MKKYAYAISGFGAGAILLIATLCVGQTTTSGTTKPASAASGQSSMPTHQSRRKSDLAVDHAGGNGVRRMAGPPSTGTNPFYESKDKAAPKANSRGSHPSNQHPAKTTTRYRPGNNKTTRARPRTQGKPGNPQS